MDVALAEEGHMLDGKTRLIGDKLAFIHLRGCLELGQETHAFRNMHNAGLDQEETQVYRP